MKLIIPVLVTRVLGSNLEINDQKPLAVPPESTDEKEKGKSNKEWPHASRITINRTFVLYFFPVCPRILITRQQQSLFSFKYRKKTSVCPFKNTAEKKKEKNEKKVNCKAYWIIRVVSRKSRSAVKKNRIMKLYFEIDMIGQLYSHVTLTM